MRRKVGFYILGLLLISIGVSALYHSKLGMNAIDAAGVNLGFMLRLTVGQSIIAINVAIILIATFISMKPHYLLSIFVSFVLGFMIDLVLIVYMMIPDQYLIIRLLDGLIGVILIPTGAAMMIYSTLPTLAGDLYMQSLMVRFRFGPYKSKYIAEITYFSSAIILGTITGRLFETVGVITIVLFLSSGFILPFVYNKLVGGKNVQQIN